MAGSGAAEMEFCPCADANPASASNIPKLSRGVRMASFHLTPILPGAKRQINILNPTPSVESAQGERKR